MSFQVTKSFYEILILQGSAMWKQEQGSFKILRSFFVALGSAVGKQQGPFKQRETPSQTSH